MSEAKSWVTRTLDESQHLTPVAGLVILGALSFIIVLMVLIATDKAPFLPRFLVSAPQEEVQETELTKMEILRSLSAGNYDTYTEEEKLDVLANLEAATPRKGEKMPTREEKLHMLSQLKSF